MIRTMLATLILLLATLTGCTTSHSNPLIPTSTHPPISLDYSINIPDPIIARALQTQYPIGIHQSPIASQLQFDYTATYHTSNVYYGFLAPPVGMYSGVGIVVAPPSIANSDSFSASEWPIINPSDPTSTVQWVGLFVYTPVWR